MKERGMEQRIWRRNGKEQNESFTLIHVSDLNIILPSTYRLFEEKINRKTSEVIDIIHHMDSTENCSVFYPSTKDYSFNSRAH